MEILVKRKSDPTGGEFAAGQGDHRLFQIYLDHLDNWADSLNVVKLSDFLDGSELMKIMYEDIFIGEEAPESWVNDHKVWYDPTQAIGSLERLIKYIETENPQEVSHDHIEGLIEDLKDCLRLLNLIDGEKDQFHLCLIY